MEKFQRAVRFLKAELVFTGAPAPKQPSPRIDGQSVQSDGHEHLQAIKESCDDQIDMAMAFEIP